MTSVVDDVAKIPLFVLFCCGLIRGKRREYNYARSVSNTTLIGTFYFSGFVFLTWWLFRFFEVGTTEFRSLKIFMKFAA